MALPTIATFGVGAFGEHTITVEVAPTNTNDGWKFLISDENGSVLGEIAVTMTITTGTNYAFQVIFQDNGDSTTCRVTPSVNGTTGAETTSGLAYVDATLPQHLQQVGSAIRFGSLFVNSVVDNSFDNITIGTTGPGSTDLFSEDFTAGTVEPPFDACIKNGSTVSPGTEFTVDSGKLHVHPTGTTTGYCQKNF